MKSFDEMKTLFETDPEEFENYRKQLIEETILSAPKEEQLKLKQLQWRLDGIHRRKNGLGATIEMSKMMWDCFYNLKEKLEELQTILNTNKDI